MSDSVHNFISYLGCSETMLDPYYETTRDRRDCARTQYPMSYVKLILPFENDGRITSEPTPKEVATGRGGDTGNAGGTVLSASDRVRHGVSHDGSGGEKRRGKTEKKETDRKAWEQYGSQSGTVEPS